MTAKHDMSPSKIQEVAYELDVKDAMSQKIMTVTPDTPMNTAREILRDHHITGLPVVENERLIGIISLANVIACLLYEGLDTRVRENMTREVNVLYTDEPLIYAVRAFKEFGYGRFPVLERDTGKLVGIVTKDDILQALLKKLRMSSDEREVKAIRACQIFQDLTSDGTTLILRHHVGAGNYKIAGKQSSHVKTNLQQLGIAPQIIRRLTVAVCEAEMNIIVFTDGGELTLAVESDRITVTAIDKGPGIPDIEKAMQPGFSTAPDWVREMGFGAGMGLPNIKRCSDDMTLTSTPGEGTHLEFTVFLNHETH